MGVSLKIKKYLLFLAVCLLLIGVGSIFGGSEDGSITYPFRIVQVSDTQPSPDNETHYQRVTKTIELINSLQPDIVIFPGDITDSGTEDEYKQIKKLLSTVEAPIHYVPGNHDTLWPADEDEKSLPLEELHEKKLTFFHKYLGPDYWSFEYGDLLFVGFDGTQNWPNLSPQRRQWLLETLLNSNKPYKFAVNHYPHIETHDTILEHLMTSAGVVGYLHGHNHTIQAYKDAKTGRLVFSSGSGTSISPENDYGVMYFDVNKDSLSCFWKPVNGDVRSLGVFDLKEAESTVSRRKDIFEIAPYIQQPKSTEVIVKWQTKAVPSAAVIFRNHGKDKWDKKNLVPKSVLNEVTLSQLEPNTKYEYYVDLNTTEFGQVKSQTISFKTPPQESNSVTFAVYGDSRSDSTTHRRVASAIAENFGDKAQLCLHVGDLVENGLIFDSWPIEFFGPAEELLSRMPLYPVLGNHEMNSDHYFDFFNLPGNERWYGFNRGPVHFIFLDSYSSLKPNSEQYKWLAGDLKNCDSPWKVMVVHTPFFSSGPHGALGTDGMPKETEMADLQTHILPLVEKYGVTIVFEGHDHLYERSKKNDTYFIITGGGGAGLYGVKKNLEQNPHSQLLIAEYHYGIVEATLDKLHYTVYNTNGKIIDEVKLTKNRVLITK
jgi:predicted phosphodiesterase